MQGLQQDRRGVQGGGITKKDGHCALLAQQRLTAADLRMRGWRRPGLRELPTSVPGAGGATGHFLFYEGWRGGRWQLPRTLSSRGLQLGEGWEVAESSGTMKW